MTAGRVFAAFVRRVISATAGGPAKRVGSYGVVIAVLAVTEGVLQHRVMVVTGAGRGIQRESGAGAACLHGFEDLIMLVDPGVERRYLRGDRPCQRRHHDRPPL